MTPEERDLLERTLKISEENNKILKNMRRAYRFATGFRIFYWVMIIGLGLGAYYVIEPYVKELDSAYAQFTNMLKNFGK